MAEFPALTLWTDAYLADTRSLSTLEHGAYLLLLIEAWRRPSCDLPDDDKILARMAGLTPTQWGEIKEVILSYWNRDGRSKVWKQKRLVKERDAARVRSKSQRDKAAKRWNKAEKIDAAASAGQSRSDASTATATATAIKERKEPNGSMSSPMADDDSEPVDFELELQGGEEPPEVIELKPEHLVEAWNAMASRHSLPAVAKLSEERRKACKTRIAEYPIEAFHTALAAIERSEFLRNGSGTWRGANFDFFIQKSSFLKLIEGQYDQSTAR